ncbi:phosphatase PAP2 family protein [Candidatus Peregrinibacteria bacterium]|nr:phosphatase PAP2 family protein [Candidatus Peregrinibacteria bacterium]
MSIFAFDSAIRGLMPHSATLTKAMLWVSALGHWKFVVAVALIVSTMLWMHGKRKSLIAFLIPLAGTETTVEILKLAVHRARPVGASFLESSHSFPSGHSAIAVALYGTLALLLWRQAKAPVEKGLFLVFALLLILLIGFSRIQLGVHFPTDVLGGYLVGSVWLLIGIRLSRKPFPFSK